MIKRQQSLILLLSLLWFFSVNALGDASSVLNHQLQQYQGLSGRFQQTLVDDQGSIIQESSGEFVLKRPGYLRWRTEDPFPQLLVSNLENIWLYDPDLEQVTIRSYQKTADQTPSLLLSGNTEKIVEKYQIEFANQSSEQSPQFILTPKFKGSSFSQLQLIFSEGLLSEMILLDSLGQTTTFRFFELTVNPPIEIEQFTFEPPAGVDVLVDD